MAADPATVAAYWASRLGQSTQKITAGVQAVTVAPGVAASRQKAAYIAGVNAKVDKWASRTAAVPLADWQNAIISKGIPRISSGATAAVPKFQNFMVQFLPAVQAAKQSLPPRGDLGANINRMTQFVTAMSKFQMH